jgi:hypothetical protein
MPARIETFKPKFLTKELVKKVLGLIKKQISFPTNGHLIVLSHELIKCNNEVFPKNYKIVPVIIYEESFGDKSKWEHDFDDMAQCQGLKTLNGGSLEGDNVASYLLCEGETWHSGSCRDKTGLLVVACSGGTPNVNNAISKRVLDKIIKLSDTAFARWKRENPKRDFL